MKLTQAEEHEAFETSHSEVQAIMEKYDRESVTRHLKGPLKWIVFALCILFSCVQLYAAFTANIPATQLRPLHLGFVMMLVFLIFPVTKKARRDVLPFYDVILSLAGMGVCLYCALQHVELANRIGKMLPIDIWVGGILIVLLFECCRRVVGLPIMCVAAVFLLYAHFGPYMPGLLAHRGKSVKQIIEQLVYTTEGIMGTPLGASSTFIFLFVLFGAFLERTEVGTFFIDFANAIAGLVRHSADYSLDTRRMPEGTEDFARWFLEESDTGYCVHYATATTVLLRAAGIPARYVEGYLTEAVPAETVTVTEKDGHAWAEYYLPGIGWIPLESTAAISVDRPIITAPETTTAEASTVPPTTEPPESTTEPSESTTIPGTDATDPSKIPVEPTDATAGTPGPNPTEPSEPAQLMPGEEKNFTLSKPVLIVICLLLLLLGQYPIRLRLREHHLRTGTPNSRGLKNWRFVCRLARLAGQTPPEELHELALRARFSPYTLTEEDLARFDGFRSQLTTQLRRRPWWQKLWHRLFRAAY